jgi:hypothetical protein
MHRAFRSARAAHWLGIAALAAASPVTCAREARAGNPQVAVGVDANAAVVTSRQLSLPFVASFGRGMEAHVGLLVNAMWLHLQPEIGYGYLELSPGSVYDWSMHRAYVGARIGFGQILVPTLYGHAGWGWRASDYPMFVADGAAWDAGIGLDLNVAMVTVGGHIGYAQIAVQPTPPAWGNVGIDAQVAFF